MREGQGYGCAKEERRDEVENERERERGGGRGSTRRLKKTDGDMNI